MPDQTFPVESLHVLMFARAIGDENAVFRDREAALAEGLPDIAAPLTFVQPVRTWTASTRCVRGRGSRGSAPAATPARRIRR